MAEKKTPTKNKSNHAKRLAQSAPKNTAEKEERQAQEREMREKYEKKKEVAKRGKKIAAVVFAVILILAFAIPSSALMLSNSKNASDSTYQASIDEYQKQLDADSSDTNAYLNIADVYYEWGKAVMQGTKSSSRDYKDLFQSAIANYNSYLDTNSSTNATINLANAYYYTDDKDSAINVLKKLTEKEPDNAMAYASLGYIYAQSDDTKSLAEENLNKAVELDPNDATGAKSQAQSILQSMSGTITLTDEDLKSSSDGTITIDPSKSSSSSSSSSSN